MFPLEGAVKLNTGKLESLVIKKTHKTLLKLNLNLNQQYSTYSKRALKQCAFVYVVLPGRSMHVN